MDALSRSAPQKQREVARALRRDPGPAGDRETSQQDTPLIQRLKRLGMAGTILHLGAHPDDEDSGMLAYMSHGHGVRTVYWSATRGEGGQNRRSPDKSEALGIVRTWESLEARRIDGGEVLYGPFYDFGFSKSGEDTLSRWGRDEVVREIARVIRFVQPLVVVSRWGGELRDGHGHHQAVGHVAAEAFEAAADSARYPELIDQGYAPWQAQKLYRSAAGDWQPGESTQLGAMVDDYERAGYLRIDTGELDPVSGLTYQEQAHLAVNRHRSQGFSFIPEPGPYHYYYRLDRSPVATAVPECSFFDGLDPTLTGLAHYPGRGSPTIRSLLEDVRRSVQTAIEAFRPQRPADAGLAVAEGIAVLRELRRTAGSERLDPDDAAALDAYLARKIRSFEDAAAACFGLRPECLVDRPRMTPGSRVRITARVWNGGPADVDILNVQLQVPPGWSVRQLAGNGTAREGVSALSPFEAGYEVELPDETSLSTPYWLREPRTPYRYRWPEAGALGLALDQPLVTAVFEVRRGSQNIRLEAAAVHRSGFVGGFRQLPLSVLPPMTVLPRQSRELLPISRADVRLDLDVTVSCIEEAGAEGTLTLATPPGWGVQPSRFNLRFARGGDSRVLRFEIVVPKDTAPGIYELCYELDSGGRISGVEVQPVRLGAHGSTGPIDETNCVAEAFRMRPAVVRVQLIDANFVRTLRYGYVEGMKEEILPALSRFGLDVTVLSDEDLAYADLKSFQGIVVGPNAYNSRGSLRQNAGRLLQYIADGGTLVVQYQGYGYDAPGLAPYAFSYQQPHDRVTSPDAPVALLEPEHPILSIPNRITREDFDQWVDDRGLYFFGEWDRRYVPILASSDRGEEPRQGGLLVAAYGRGTYVYAAYSFFRQVPAGVPGAVRLFANVLGLPEVLIRQRTDLLRGHELFAFMSDDELYEAARMMSERWVEAGTFLSREGDRGSELFILVDGAIETVKHLPAGDRVLHVAQRGEAIGEFAILANMPRSASIRAKTDVTVIVLPAEAFQDWLRRYPDLSLRMMELLVRKIVSLTPNN